ncbi:hypothetical protein [Mycolicibacterium sp. XJ1819]
MLAAFGLQRLEASLSRDTVSVTDVAGFLNQAEAADVSKLARDGMSPALDGLQQRLAERHKSSRTVSTDRSSTGLPARLSVRHQTNTEFRPTRHANRV